MEKKDFTDAVRDKIGREPPFGLKKAFLAGPLLLGLQDKKKSRVHTRPGDLGKSVVSWPPREMEPDRGGRPPGPAASPSGRGLGPGPAAGLDGAEQPGEGGAGPGPGARGGAGGSHATEIQVLDWGGAELGGGAGGPASARRGSVSPRKSSRCAHPAGPPPPAPPPPGRGGGRDPPEEEDPSSGRRRELGLEGDRGRQKGGESGGERGGG